MKHALIIGGTKGTGRVLSKFLLDEGYKVSVIGRTLPEENNKILGVEYFPVDISDKEKLPITLKKILENGKINSLIFLHRYRGSGDKFDGEIEVSIKATKYIIESLSDNFAQGDKSIVLASSLADHIIVDQDLSYHVAKSAISQMARYYAAKLGKKGIRVNCVSPGALLKEESKKFYTESGLESLYKNVIPLGRMCNPEDVSNVISFLCSSKASFITGQNIIVDGGSSLLQQESLAKNLINSKD